MKTRKKTARIFQINLSDGGVPKLAQAQAEITLEGLQGDRQRDLRHHGGPDRAVCLYSLEVILALQEEGHPIFPGAVGENITLTGLDWDALEPGTRLLLGDQVLLEITRYTVPCSNLTSFFTGGDINRISQKKNPGWSRVYARVLQPGCIQTGDAVEVVSL